MPSRGVRIDLSIPLSGQMKAVLLVRLEERTEKTGTCWLFGGARRNRCHAEISVRDYPTYVHQVSYAIHHGPIPPGRVVRHTCDVGNCWRPDHLLLGSQRENVADMWARGREHRPPVRVGESHPAARLTDEQVAEIRRRWFAHPRDQRALAREYGCSQSTIWRLVHRHTREVAA